MKVKLLVALSLLAVIASGSAVKVRPLSRYAQKRAVLNEQQKEAQLAAEKAEDATIEDKSESQSESQSSSTSEPVKLQRKEDVGKDVHKRGIYYNGGLGYGAHAVHATPATYWPKSYAAHYGYSLNLPGATAYSNVAAHAHAHGPVYAHAPAFAHAPAYAAHAHAPTFLKYPSAGGFHLKQFAAGPAAFPVGTYGGSTIGLGNTAIGLGLGTATAVQAVAPTAVATLPHSHWSPFASAAGAVVAPVAPAVAPAFAPAVASAGPVSPFVLRPGGAVVSSYNVNFPRLPQKPVVGVPHLTPVQPLAHVHPVQPLQPVRPLQPLHPVQPLQPLPALAPAQPVQPVHSVVQVQHTTHPLTSVQPLHHLPHYFQTSFVQPQRIPVAVPAAPVPPVPALPAVPLTPSFPAVHSFPSAPALPAIPIFPSAPPFPAIPTVPAVSAVPATPSVPTTPAINIPTSPPTASHPNPVFPLGVQPPTRPQQPPTFVSIPVQPEAQFPPLGPLPGSQRPEGGSAEAAPQIPNILPIAAPLPESDLPAVQGSQEPWKPILSYGPPNFDRPALTLLPPYGSSPGEAYLPPSASGQQQSQQQQQQGLFDNLSDSEIEHIFAQAANLAAQHAPQPNHHRTFSNY